MPLKTWWYQGRARERGRLHGGGHTHTHTSFYLWHRGPLRRRRRRISSFSLLYAFLVKFKYKTLHTWSKLVWAVTDWWRSLLQHLAAWRKTLKLNWSIGSVRMESIHLAYNNNERGKKRRETRHIWEEKTTQWPEWGRKDKKIDIKNIKMRAYGLTFMGCCQP